MTLNDLIDSKKDQYMSLRKAYAVAKMALPNLGFSEVQNAVHIGTLIAKKTNWSTRHYRYRIKPIDIIDFFKED